MNLGFQGLLRTQIRVVLALLLREARVRYGRSRLGYMWAIIDPVVLISALSILFSNFRGEAPYGTSFALFFATGVLPYKYFSNTASYLGAAFESNRPLFNYPVVKQIDTIYARFILDTATVIVVMCLVFGVLSFIYDIPPPHDIFELLVVFVLIAQFGFGVGLMNAVIRRKINSWNNLFRVIMGPTFFLSGIFYPLDSIPTPYRQYLSWNPIIHCVEGYRKAYYPDYRSFELDLEYLFWIGFLASVLGIALERVVRKEYE